MKARVAGPQGHGEQAIARHTGNREAPAIRERVCACESIPGWRVAGIARDRLGVELNRAGDPGLGPLCACPVGSLPQLDHRGIGACRSRRHGGRPPPTQVRECEYQPQRGYGDAPEHPPRGCGGTQPAPGLVGVLAARPSSAAANAVDVGKRSAGARASARVHRTADVRWERRAATGRLMVPRPAKALGNDRLCCRPGEWRLAGEHLVDHAGKTVLVAAPVDVTVRRCLLRAHVGRVPSVSPVSVRRLPGRILERRGDAEVGQV